jgi:arsenate reductase
MGGEKFEVYSAGTEATRVNPLTVKAMQEAGYDLSQHFSKTMDRFLGQHFDYVITVCSESEDRCPFFPGGVKREHWPFEDPGSGPGSDSEKLEVFRIVRDQIEQKISTWLEELS